jgi:hypothetical protein
VVAQRTRRPFEVTVAVDIEVQADEVHDPDPCLLDIRSQVLGSEIRGNLHHSLRRIVENAADFLLIDDPACAPRTRARARKTAGRRTQRVGDCQAA